jgi:outer membrane protein assembly factor BamB
MGVGVIAIIDLGEIPARPAIDDPPVPPGPHRRRTMAALTLAIVLSTVAAGDPLPRPLPTVVLDVPGDVRVLVDGDRLYVVQPFALSQGRRDGRYVAAFRLMDLRQLWRVELPLGRDVYGITTVDGVLALTGDPTGRPVDEDPGPSYEVAGPDTVGLDPATGALLWRHKGFVEGVTPAGRLILSAQFGNPGAIPANTGPGRTLRAVAGTGEIVWSYDPPAGALRSYRLDDDAVTLLAVALPDGRVELRDADTGELVRWGRIGSMKQGRYVEIVGDLLLVREESEVLAYGIDRLDLRWRTPFEPGQDRFFSACGAAICIRHDEAGLDVVDPATGRLRWSDARWTQAFAADGWLMATDFDRRHDEQTVVVVDPYTGRVQRELGRWHALDIAGGSVVALRFDSTRAVVGRLDPAHGVRIVGVLRDVIGGSCRVRPPSLWCRHTDSTLGVWRLPG